jgi:hypothetical protein
MPKVTRFLKMRGKKFEVRNLSEVFLHSLAFFRSLSYFILKMFLYYTVFVFGSDSFKLHHPKSLPVLLHSKFVKTRTWHFISMIPVNKNRTTCKMYIHFLEQVYCKYEYK